MGPSSFVKTRVAVTPEGKQQLEMYSVDEQNHTRLAYLSSLEGTFDSFDYDNADDIEAELETRLQGDRIIIGLTETFQNKIQQARTAQANDIKERMDRRKARWTLRRQQKPQREQLKHLRIMGEIDQEAYEERRKVLSDKLPGFPTGASKSSGARKYDQPEDYPYSTPRELAAQILDPGAPLPDDMTAFLADPLTT